MAHNIKHIKCPHCHNIIDFDNNQSNQNKLDVIQQKFYDSLVGFVDEFGRKTIREFYEFWSEPNKSKTKIRWQLEKTWDTKRRIQRWKRNNFSNEKNRSTNRNSFESDTTQRTIEQVQNGFE